MIGQCFHFILIFRNTLWNYVACHCFLWFSSLLNFILTKDCSSALALLPLGLYIVHEECMFHCSPHRAFTILACSPSWTLDPLMTLVFLSELSPGRLLSLLCLNEDTKEALANLTTNSRVQTLVMWFLSSSSLQLQPSTLCQPPLLTFSSVVWPLANCHSWPLRLQHHLIVLQGFQYQWPLFQPLTL